MTPRTEADYLRDGISNCPRCEGAGEYARIIWDENKGWVEIRYDCAVCNGTGRIGPDGGPAK